jgi:4-amino-4-deoxy-L-arabinose transferase-like glycosyltransferase
MRLPGISTIVSGRVQTIRVEGRKKPVHPAGLCITLLTALYQAFAFTAALSFLITAGSADFGSIELESLERAGAPSTTQSHLWVKALLVDGRNARWETIDHRVGWELVFNRGSSPNPELSYKRGSQTAALNFQAKRFVAVLESADWTGTIRVKRNGQAIRALTVQDSDSLFCVEGPIAPPSTAVFLVSFIVIVGCGWFFGPARGHGKSVCWLAVFVGLLHLSYWAIQMVATWGDSIGYLDSVKPVFVEGRPSYYPPGYSALLGIVGTFAGSKLGRWMTLIQHGMVVTMALWIYCVLRRIMSETSALVGGLVAGALPVFLTAPQTILSETATCFAMVGSLYCAVRFREGGKWAFGLLSGVLMGWAGMLRVLPLIALLPAICILFLLPRVQSGLSRVSIIATSAIVVFALPIAWCGYKSGQATIAYSTALHLYNRVVSQQKLLNEQGPATRTLIVLLGGQDPTEFRHWDVMPHLAQLSFDESLALLKDVAIEGISKDPMGFVAYSFRLAWQTFLIPTDAAWTSTWAETASVSPRLENPPILPFGASSVAWRWMLNDINDILWPILCWMAIAGTILGLLGRQRQWVAAFALIMIAMLLGAASVDILQPRYNAPVAPFVVILAMFPIDLLMQRLRTKPLRQFFLREPLANCE